MAAEARHPPRSIRSHLNEKIVTQQILKTGPKAAIYRIRVTKQSRVVLLVRSGTLRQKT